MRGSKVAVADNASVAFAPNQKVGLDPNVTVDVSTPTLSLTPTQAQLQTNASDALSNISTSYTVFYSQPTGTVGLKAAGTAMSEYVDVRFSRHCNYIAGKDDRHFYRMLTASDGNRTPSVKTMPGFDSQKASSKARVGKSKFLTMDQTGLSEEATPRPPLIREHYSHGRRGPAHRGQRLFRPLTARCDLPHSRGARNL